MPDRQLIVQAHSDQAIRLGSTNLAAKAQSRGVPTEIVDFPAPGDHQAMHKLVDAVGKLTPQSRLYLRGHGSWRDQTVGGVDARDWARTLLNAGLRRVAVISICACQAARDLGSSDACRISASADSFASKFHRYVREMGNWHENVPLYARVYLVMVRSQAHQLGVKHTGDRVIGPQHRRPKSKLLFTWVNGHQKREWVDYAHGGTASIEEDLAIADMMAIEID